MQAIQYARYRTCHGASSKEKHEGCRCSFDDSFTSQEHCSSLGVLHKLISVEISAEVFEGASSLQDRKKKDRIKNQKKIIFFVFL